MATRHKQIKKKQREREVQKKLLARRSAQQRIKKAERDEELARIAVEKRADAAAKNTLKKHMTATEIMQKNLETLQGLKAEHEKEKAQRQAINSKLESEGNWTIEEKMNAIQEKLAKDAEKFQENHLQN